ncbi:MAG: PPOX class F420-dependent oxidoreductase [Nitrososphaeraceae archaeon]
MNENIRYFIDGKYINIETFKKNGNSVRTPVWYIIYNNIIYIRSDKNSGKVKRIRKNTHVRIAKCNMFGKLNGEIIEGTAHVNENKIEKNIDKFFDNKYGIKNKIIKLMYKIKKINMVLISVKIN